MCGRKFKIYVFAGVLFCFFSGAVPIQAQQSAKCGFMCHTPMAYQGGGGQMGWRGLRPLEGDFTQMKARFGIKPEQETAWKEFEEAVIQGHAAPGPQTGPGMTPPKTPMEKAKLMEQAWGKRYQKMKAVNDAFKKLYEVLDENQKRTADRRFGYCEINR